MAGQHYRHQGHLWPATEQHVLLQAALLDGKQALDAFAQWRAKVDWEDELGYPTLRLLPLVYHNLLRLQLDDPLMGRLKGVYRRFWCENQTLFFLIAAFIKHLQENGVDVLLLKGAPLVLGYYKNHALRPMSDIDLAVRPEQLPRALALLRELDWDAGPMPSPEDLRYQHAVGCLRDFEEPLDVHFHIARDCMNSMADDWFWADIEPMDFQGIPVWQLAPTAMLFHTIIHGVRWNEETPVRWIPDAIMVLRQRGDEVDWPKLLAFADSQRLTHRLALGVGYLSTEFGLELPETVTAHLRAYRSGGLRERIENTIVLGARSRWYTHPLTKQWVFFAEYCGLTEMDRPWAFLIGFSHYLRYRWGLRGRLEILPTIARGLWRRIA
ncbi:nucleotidyltransferase family protein [Methylovulum sp.]|uniref:nucleotidyltransferase family protein n=1 Tax=Methylovulum sp. TaxID=1916980 RepID=UPI00262279F1|nr:nucleotidyltransferase family protein [Methylovulum sp.]MDD5125258.1 nucleotidyltransferase family protein [Methylovulum sp.]